MFSNRLNSRLAADERGPHTPQASSKNAVSNRLVCTTQFAAAYLKVPVLTSNDPTVPTQTSGYIDLTSMGVVTSG